MMTRRIITLALTLCLHFFCASSGKATQTTLDEEALLDLAPRITLEEPGITSFLVEGTIDFGNFGISFIAVGEAPDHVLVRVFDLQDGTPILAGSDNTAMFYDPLIPRVLIDAYVLHFCMRIEDSEDESENGDTRQKFMFGFALHPLESSETETRKLRRNSVLIDIASILEGVKSPINITSDDGEHFVAQGVSEKGSKAVIFVSPNRKEGAFSRIELYNKGKSSPFVILNRIELNGPVPYRFDFPENALLSSSLPIAEIPDCSFSNESAKELAKQIYPTFWIRTAMKADDAPQLRQDVERALERKIEWESLREKDKVNSAILRAVFKPGEDPPLID
jgi:hypothetical protein